MTSLSTRSETLHDECCDEENNTANMLEGTDVIEESKRKEKCCCLSCGRGDRHGKGAKVLGNGSGTARTEKSHGRKKNHDKYFSSH